MFSNPLDISSKKNYTSEEQKERVMMYEMKRLDLQIEHEKRQAEHEKRQAEHEKRLNEQQRSLTRYYDLVQPVLSDQNVDSRAKMRLLNEIRPFMPPPRRDDTEKTPRDDSYPSRESHTNAIMESGINPGPYFQRALLQHSIPPSHFERQFEPSQSIRRIDPARSQLEFSGRRVMEEEKEEPHRIPPRAVPSTPSHSDFSVLELSSRAYRNPQGGDNSRAGYDLGGPRAGSGRVFLGADHDVMSNLSFPSINGEGDNGEGDDNGDNHGDAN